MNSNEPKILTRDVEASVVPIGTNVVVSWTNLFPCYTLQIASDLSSNGWVNYSGPAVTNGGNVYITNNPAFTNRFYRLSY